MKVFESDFGEFKMYVSDFKNGAPGYIWHDDSYDDPGWYKAKVTYVRFYDESRLERLLDFFDVSDNEELYERFPKIFRDEGTCGEFITDDFNCWVCMEEYGKEIPEDEIDIEVIGYC